MDNVMTGRICLVTGATQGIGLVTAQALAQQGAAVIIVSRNPARCAATAGEIKRQAGNPAVDFIAADLSSQHDIRQAAEVVKSRYKELHVLVNNAGSTFGKRQESADGLEMNFALNHAAYFLLTNLLLDTLKASLPARILNVSSEVHGWCKGIDFNDLQSHQRYSEMQAYARSKLANVLFTYELARRLANDPAAQGLTVNALNPGVVKTNFQMQGGFLGRLSKRMGNLFVGVSPEKGAETSIYLATSPEVESVTGKYFEKMKAVPSSNASYDEDAARRLWQATAELTGLPA
jgi:NAD(P)-dependent dehydrogenase (short-subunit alcohol dehydrogenase family)